MAFVASKIIEPSGVWDGRVTIDGEAAPVYKVEHGDRKTTCFIEAVENKEFMVHCSNTMRPPIDMLQALFVDGTEVACSLVKKGTLPGSEMFEGARISDTSIRPFKFAQIALTDDSDEACETEAVVKNLGTIHIHLFRTRILGESGSAATYGDVKQPIVDEKSKKATMSHSTAYGAAKASSMVGRPVTFKYIDPLGSPWHVLEFKYRSRTLLELEGIVEPRANHSPAPASASASGSGSPAVNRKKRKPSNISLSPDGDDEDGDDLRAKVARLEAENSRLRAGGVKKEKEDVKPKVPKGEPIGKVIKENGRTVIDLLDEDSD